MIKAFDLTEHSVSGVFTAVNASGGGGRLDGRDVRRRLCKVRV